MSDDRADVGSRHLSGLSPANFVRGLREEVGGHSAVTHPFLRRFAAGDLARWQIWGYASQHYRLVCFFTTYLEAIAGRTPDPQVRELLHEILEDEYIRRQGFERSHPALYRRFLRAVGFEEGAWEKVPWLPATDTFVRAHIDLTLRSWLLGLGAIGPGHEWAIPLMFPSLVAGIERSLALEPAALEYFRLHIDLDVEHGRILEGSCSGGPPRRRRKWISGRARSAPSQRVRLCGAPWQSICSRDSRRMVAKFWSKLTEPVWRLATSVLS